MPMTLTRSLLSILIPGIVAAAPWLLLLVAETEIGDAYTRYQFIANTLLLALIVVVGSVFEGIGTFLEVLWDKERDAKYQIDENWYDYLARSFENEPVGYRYISRRATTMYFEISMSIAIPIFVAGCAVLLGNSYPDEWLYIALASLILGAVLAIYFYWQGRCTHKVLCVTRKELMQRLGKNT